MFILRESGSRNDSDLAARRFLTVLNIIYHAICYYILSLLLICYIVQNLDLTWSIRFTVACFIFLLRNICEHIPILVENTVSGTQGDFSHGRFSLRLENPTGILLILWAKIHTQPQIYLTVKHTCRQELQANGTTFMLFSKENTGRTTYLKNMCGIPSPKLTHQFLDLWLWGWSKSLLTTAPWYSCPRRRESWKAIVTTRSIWGRVLANLSLMWWKDGFIFSGWFVTKAKMFVTFVTNLHGKRKKRPIAASTIVCC